MMFVTLFLGFFNTRTGGLLFCNGGHNPPYLIRPGEARMITMEPAMALGVSDQVPYGDQFLQLHQGETLLLYTDGVTEAMDGRNRLYTEGRLEAVLNRLPVLKAETVCHAVLDDLALFVNTNEQSDDITMLALHYQGRDDEGLS